MAQDYGLGPLVTGGHHFALLEHVLKLGPGGVALEFGSGSGESTRLIADHMPVVGFDSCQGLPEDWRPEFPKGAFASWPPIGLPNASFVLGDFADVLPNWAAYHSATPVGLVHFDCDLYRSTKTALDNIGHMLQPGCYIVFDEWHGYDDGPGAAATDHEQRAWREHAASTGIQWAVIGHGEQSWAIRIAHPLAPSDLAKELRRDTGMPWRDCIDAASRTDDYAMAVELLRRTHAEGR